MKVFKMEPKDPQTCSGSTDSVAGTATSESMDEELKDLGLNLGPRMAFRIWFDREVDEREVVVRVQTIQYWRS
jgi:hypothetical protein